MATVRIIITASARAAVAAFSAIGAALRRMTAMAQRAGATIARVAPFALMAAKVTIAVGAVAALTGALGNLLGAVQLIAPAVAAGGLAVLGFKLALNGVGDALDAGLSGDVEKFEKALKKLAPQAADTVRALVDLRNKWKPLAKDFQGRVFEGAASEIRSLSGFIKPIADRWLPRLALRFAEVRKSIADGIARYAADGRLEAVWRNIHVAVSNLLGAIEPLGRAFGDILEVAAPAFAEITGSIEGAAKKFSDWIRQAKENGDLHRWLDTARETADKLWQILLNVGTAIAGIFSASQDEGSGVLDGLVESTKALSDWVNSGDGQSMIDAFAGIAEAISKAAPMLQTVLYFIGLTSDAWRMMGEIGKAVWDGIVIVAKGAIMWIISGWGMVLEAGVRAFGWIPGIGDKLKAAQASFENFKNSVNNSLNGIQKTIDIKVVYRAVRIGPHMVSGAQQSGEYSSGIGGRASGGIASGLTWVGEQGPELVDFSQGRVFNSAMSKRMVGLGPVSGRGGGGGALTMMVAPGGGNVERAMGEIVTTAIRRGWVQLKDASGMPVRVA